MKNNFTSKELIEAKKSNSLTGQMKNFTKYEIHKIYNELLRCKELSFTYWYSEPFDYRAGCQKLNLVVSSLHLNLILKL